MDFCGVILFFWHYIPTGNLIFTVESERLMRGLILSVAAVSRSCDVSVTDLLIKAVIGRNKLG